MITRKDSVIVDMTTRVMVPIIQIFALYVIFHGHYSPGGGFQGGALLVGSILLQRVVLGRERSQSGFVERLAIPFGIVGILMFFGIGLWPQVLGANFLQHDGLPFPMDEVWLRNTGILIAEIGVGFAVMGILISIFDDLASGGEG